MKSNTKNCIIALLIFIVLILIGTFVIVNQIKKEKTEEVKIGAILPLTGAGASLGKQILDGELFAVATINYEGGINGRKLKLLYEDGQSDPKISLNAFHKLVKINKVKIITANLSNVVLTLLPEVEKSNILFFGDAAHPKITGGSKYVFRHSHTASQEAKTIGKFVIQELKADNIVLGYMVDDYGISFKDELERYLDLIGAKNKLKGTVSFEKDEKDFMSVATKILKSGPDVVIIAGFEEGPGRIVRRLKEMGYRGEVVGTISFSTPSAKNAAGDAAFGVYHPIYDMPIDDPKYGSRAFEFYKNFNYKITPFNLLGYNTIYLIATAIKETGSLDRDELSDHIKRMRKFEGFAENMEIQLSGDINPELRIVQIKI